MTACCPIIELRHYTLCAGRRDALIELFERAFIESQEALGISIIGQFRARDDANRFVWQVHRTAANATMLDSDNVLLLRPTREGAGFVLAERRDRTEGDASSVVIATIHYLDEDAGAFANFFAAAMSPTIIAAGGPILATLATETASNTFPRLPVREKERVFIWFSAFPDLATYQRFRTALEEA